MKTEIKEISKSVKELKISVPAEEALNDYQKIANRIKKSVMIPGFRKGKAPLSMIEQMYGDYIKEEYFDKKLGDYYKQALEENKINPVSEGKPLKIEWEKGKDLEAVFQYEIMPEIKVENYKNLKIPFEKTEFDEKMVDDTIEDFRKNNATLSDADSPSQKGDFLEIELKLFDEEGNVSKELKRYIELGNNAYSEDFNKSLTGKKAGEEVKTTLFSKEQKSTDKDIPDEIKDKEFLVKIISVKRRNLPEINDEFAKDMDFESLADLRKKIAEDLKKELKDRNENILRNAIQTELIKKNPLEIPPSFIEKYAASMLKSQKQQINADTQQMMEFYKILAEHDLKAHYLIQEIIKKENIEVTEEDKEEIIKEAAENLKIEPEKYKQLYKNYIESKDFEDSVKTRKAYKLIEESAEFVPLPKKEETKNSEPKENK